MYALLRAKNEGLNEDTLKFTQKLIRVPSLSLEEGRVAGIVEKELKEVGYDDVFRDDFGNVVGILHGPEAEPGVLLSCHMDTVPADHSGVWEGAPTGARIEDGHLIGLGAADCKGGLAAQLYAGVLLKRALLPLRGNLIFAATTAEENGRSVGITGLMKKTLPELEMKPDYAILGEPTNLGLYYGHDGWMEVEVLVEGPDSFQVDDAAKAIYADSIRRSSGQPETMTVHRPHFENTEQFHRATIRLDRRLREAEQAEQVVGQVEHNANLAAQSVAAVAVKAIVREENQELYTGHKTLVRHVTHAWATDPFHPLLDRARHCLAAAGCEARPGKWRLGRMGMGTAGSVLTERFQLPTVGYGPGDEEQAHQPNESVEIDKVFQAVYGTAAIVHGLIGYPVVGWTSDEI